MKKIYKNKLPKGMIVKELNISFENGEVSVEVELEREPKKEIEFNDGDFLVDAEGDIFIFNGVHDKNTDEFREELLGAYIASIGDTIEFLFEDNKEHSSWTSARGCRHATKEEKEKFLKKLEMDCNKTWDSKTKTLINIDKTDDVCNKHNICPRCAKFQCYFTINEFFDVVEYIETFTEDDNKRYKIGNYFTNREDATVISERIKKMLNFH